MKTRTTKKAIMASFENVIRIPNESFHYLLSTRKPNFYTASAELGWGADVYIINHETVIVTGYRAFGNIEPDRGLIQTVERMAEKNTRDNNDWLTRDVRNTELIKDFLKALELIHDLSIGATDFS